MNYLNIYMKKNFSIYKGNLFPFIYNGNFFFTIGEMCVANTTHIHNFYLLFVYRHLAFLERKVSASFRLKRDSVQRLTFTYIFLLNGSIIESKALS